MPRSLWTTWTWTKDKLTLMNPCIYGERALCGHKTGGGNVPAPYFRRVLRHREAGGWKICGNRAPLWLILCLLVSFEPELRLQQIGAFTVSRDSRPSCTATHMHLYWYIHLTRMRTEVLCALWHRKRESVQGEPGVVVMPSTQESLIRLCPLEHLALTAAVNSPTQPSQTQCKEKQCGWL